MASLGSDALREQYEQHKLNSLRLPESVAQLKPNFPPSVTGVYTVGQAKELADRTVRQSLRRRHPAFHKQFIQDPERLSVQVFRPLRLVQLLNFQKHYVGQRAPKGDSDLGDLLHLYLLPYRAVAVLERDLCELLGQTKRHDPTLGQTTLLNIQSFRSLLDSY